MAIQSAFDAAARSYDSLRRLLIPCFDDFYGAVVELVPYRQDQGFRALDLGAGTGLLSRFLLDAFPRMAVELADLSEGMLAIARERFAGDGRVSYLAVDYAHSDMQGPYDLIASALSIHHLSGEEKRLLFRRCHEALAPGGVFINADQVLAPTEALDRRYRDHWLRRVRQSGIGEADLAEALDRTRYDRMSDLESQLGWLKDAGFTDVDCVYRDFSFAVFSGTRRNL